MLKPGCWIVGSYARYYCQDVFPLCTCVEMLGMHSVIRLFFLEASAVVDFVCIAVW